MSRPSSWYRFGRLVALVVVSVAGALAVALGAEWWLEWPLRKARTALAAGDAARAVALTDYFLDAHPDTWRG